MSRDQTETLLRCFSKGSVPENEFPGNLGLYSFLLVYYIVICVYITYICIVTHFCPYLGYHVESSPFLCKVDMVIVVLQMKRLKPNKVRGHLTGHTGELGFELRSDSKLLLLAIE